MDRLPPDEQHDPHHEAGGDGPYLGPRVPSGDIEPLGQSHHYGETGRPAEPQSGFQMFLRRVLGPLALLLFAFFKYFKLAFIALKGVKFFGTAISMVVSVAAYAVFWGWKFAVGFVLLIFVHELGHAIQMRREGIRTGPITFLPFLGAVIAMREMPRNALVEARVGLAGPIVGSFGALLVYWAALRFDSLFLQALAFTGFFLNLFNLLPVSPLDGGRAMAAVSPKMWLVGMLALVALVISSPNPILILIALFGLLETWSRWRGRKQAEDYYSAVTPRQRTAVFLTYVGLAAALGILMDLSHVPREL